LFLAIFFAVVVLVSGLMSPFVFRNDAAEGRLCHLAVEMIAIGFAGHHLDRWHTVFHAGNGE
jgi:hypothetical protein